MELEFELPDGLSDGAKSIEADHTYRLRIAELVAEDQSEYKTFLEELNKKIMPFLQDRFGEKTIEESSVYDTLIRLEGARRLVEGWVNEFAYDRFT